MIDKFEKRLSEHPNLQMIVCLVFIAILVAVSIQVGIWVFDNTANGRQREIDNCRAKGGAILEDHFGRIGCVYK